MIGRPSYARKKSELYQIFADVKANENSKIKQELESQERSNWIERYNKIIEVKEEQNSSAIVDHLYVFIMGTHTETLPRITAI